jgi:IclR family KDG regulon transcriptional repressor
LERQVAIRFRHWRILVASKRQAGQSVQTVDRAMVILERLGGGRRPAERGISELARDLALGKSTVHRLLTTLAAHRFVERNPDTGKYRLGWGLFELGNRVPDLVSLQRACRPGMERLCEVSGETVNLAVRQGADAVIIEKVEPRDVLRVYLEVGRREPLHATALGKALLIEFVEEELARLYEGRPFECLTERTATSARELDGMLEVVRREGCAVDDEEFYLNLRCVGAPIYGHTGKVVAAVSISGPAQRLTMKRIPALKEVLIGAARDMSATLGFGNLRSPAWVESAAGRS